ncbi:MAG TPA: HepT-like ribonuclease domain-containing protein [Planctomycetaceae bacterium]|nr:HepT-like ribonuclease domain-containing protein [Planctomycetaceae bacterium]
MLDHAEEALLFATGRRRSDLDADRALNLSLTRLLEVIGEAAARVTEPTRNQCPQIPWPQIVGLRNRLIHGYDLVDFDVLWRIVQNDLPPLVTELRSILASGSPPTP